MKRGALKTFDDGSLDPALAKSDWRTGNFKPIRGGKPRAAQRQLATAPRQLAAEASEVATNVSPGTSRELVAAGLWEPEKADTFRTGVLTALSGFGSGVPALATEIAGRHGLDAEAAAAFYGEVRQAVRDAMDQALAEEGVSPDQASAYYDPDDGGPFLPPADFRLPGESKDGRWARIIPF